MSMRLIQITADPDKSETILEVLEAHEVEGIHTFTLSEDQIIVRGILFPEEVEPIIEELDPDKKGGIHRIFLTNVEAIVPKIEREEEPEDPPAEKDKASKQVTVGKFIRISKEELRGDIEESSQFNLNYIMMVVLSSIVAGIGILKENEAIIIGAMVIAPFLGPNVALAFGTTIGDLKMIRRSLRTALIGTGIAIGISVLWGLIDRGNVQGISHDIFVEYRDIALALTCGLAGVLSMMTGQATSLVGVMVAAALLPPLMRAGLFLGGQLWMPALNSFLIFMVNVICVNLAGIITFYLSGIRPKFWWEEQDASRQRRQALLIGSAILVLLVVTIALIRKFGF